MLLTTQKMLLVNNVINTQKQHIWSGYEIFICWWY